MNRSRHNVGSVHLYQTNADLGAVPSTRTWEAVRSLRANPPSHASDKNRRATFTSALEQAEQLFLAAESVGLATRPLLIFYGLSQAGRAIAAAHADTSWKLTGHGIGNGATDTPGGLAGLTVVPRTNGSFARIRELVGSSSLPSTTRLGDLWPLLAETAPFPVEGSSGQHSLAVSVEAADWGYGIPVVTVHDLPNALLDIGQSTREPFSGLGANYGQQAEAVATYLQPYPSLSPRLPFTSNGEPVGLQLADDFTSSIRFRWPESVYEQHPTPGSLLREIATTYGAQARAYPSLDGGPRPVHPLMIWWALLFRLSMLARYEPEEWVRTIDVNTSPDAVPVEHLLTAALTSVPELIYRAITEPPDAPAHDAAPASEYGAEWM